MPERLRLFSWKSTQISSWPHTTKLIIEETRNMINVFRGRESTRRISYGHSVCAGVNRLIPGRPRGSCYEGSCGVVHLAGCAPGSPSSGPSRFASSPPATSVQGGGGPRDVDVQKAKKPTNLAHFLAGVPATLPAAPHIRRLLPPKTEY